MNTNTLLEKALKLTKDLCYLYVGLASQDNFISLVEMLDDQLSIIGTGQHELYHNKEDFIKALILNQNEVKEMEFEVINEEYHGISLSETTCLVYGKFWLKEKNIENKPTFVDMNTRLTVVFQVVNNELKVIHVHHSMPYIDQGEDEYYPKTIVEKANKAINYSHFLEKVVQQDSLTKLYNRITTENKIDEFLQKQYTHYAFFMLDIDNFKMINDTYGHPIGDTILLDISKTLKNIFEDFAYIGRIGGDEFVVFSTQDISIENVQIKAQEILDALEDLSHQHQFKISCSIGIAFSDKDHASFSQLFSKADKALYHSKTNGKARYHIQ